MAYIKITFDKEKNKVEVKSEDLDDREQMQLCAGTIQNILQSMKLIQQEPKIKVAQDLPKILQN